MRKLNIFFILSFIAQTVVAQSLEVTSKIVAAKVFLKGAQVERQCEVSLKKGVNIVTIKDLPPRLDGNSVQVAAPSGVKIYSVNYRLHKETSEIPKDSIELLQQQIKTLNEEQEDLSHQLNVYQGEERLISASYNLHGPDGLNPERLGQMADLYRKRLLELKQLQLDLRRKITELSTRSRELQAKIGKMSSNKTETTGHILVEIESSSSQTQTLDFSYLILDAGWYPKYDMRADDVENPILLEMRGDVWQNSGEDWENIQLSLSTANPNMSLDAPVVYPWVLREEVPVAYQSGYQSSSYTHQPAPAVSPSLLKGKVYDANTGEALIGANVYLKDNPTVGCITDIEGKFELNLPQGNRSNFVVSYLGYTQHEQVIPTAGYINIPLREDGATLESVQITSVNANQVSRVRGLTTYLNWNGSNVVATDKEKSEAAVKKFISSIQPRAASQQNLYSSQLYEIDRKYSIESGGQPERVQIKNIELGSEFTYYSAPKISEYVYLIATISDWEKHNLLNGQVNLFFEGTYIGRSLLDVKNFGDTIEVSFGPDRDVIVERKMVSEYSKKQFIGPNKKENRVVEINIKNKKQKPISVVVQDQIPISATNKISISHKVNGQEPNELTGILTWEFDLDGNASNTVQFEYEVKMPKKVFLQLD